MNSVFAITCSASTNHIRDAEFYSTREKACLALKEKTKERRHKLGVRIIDDTDVKFSFCLGWEEHFVCFSVVEFEVK